MLGAVLSLALSGCGVGGAPEGVVGSCDSNLELPPGISTDILFVIDDSLSMSEEQEKVALQLERFVTTLRESPVPHDFQVGVVTTGVTMNAVCGEAGEFRRYEDQAGTLQPLGGDGPRILSFDDEDFLADFQTLVRQGIAGSPQEMGLEAMRLALSGPKASKENRGFLRKGSRLLVVIVSDEDDCSDPTGTALAIDACNRSACSTDDDCGGDGSYCLPNYIDAAFTCQPNVCESEAGRALLEPVGTYVDFLRNLDDGTGTGRKRDVFLAVIGAVSDDEELSPERCQSEEDSASGIAVRYKEAVEAMGSEGYLDSICAGEYGSSLEAIARLVNTPQVIDLERAPADGRLLTVEIERQDGSRIRCRDGDGFAYEPPTKQAGARVILEDSCRLQPGDQLGIRLFCAN